MELEYGALVLPHHLFSRERRDGHSVLNRRTQQLDGRQSIIGAWIRLTCRFRDLVHDLRPGQIRVVPLVGGFEQIAAITATYTRPEMDPHRHGRLRREWPFRCCESAEVPALIPRPIRCRSGDATAPPARTAKVSAISTAAVRMLPSGRDEVSTLGPSSDRVEVLARQPATYVVVFGVDRHRRVHDLLRALFCHRPLIRWSHVHRSPIHRRTRGGTRRS